MSNATRTGRRRRLLQEGISAQSSADLGHTTAEQRASSVRYVPRPDSVSFAIATALPRTYAGILLVFGALTLPLLGMAVVDSYTSQTLSDPHSPGASILKIGGAYSISTWWTANSWLLLSLVSLLVFGLRRLRMDDLRSGYRWWVVASAAGVAMSLNASTQLHTWLSAELARLIGWSPLAGDALWWLAPGVLVLAGLGVRLCLDLSDSRIAVGASLLAMAAVGYGWFITAGLAPSPGAPWLSPAATASMLVMLGQTLALLAMLCYVRRIVREAEGVESRPAAVAKPKIAVAKKTEPTNSTTASPKPAESRDPASRKSRREANTSDHEPPSEAEVTKESTETAWTDGAEGDYSDEYDDQPNRRRLSKAERKRLRKQKARRAA